MGSVMDIMPPISPVDESMRHQAARKTGVEAKRLNAIEVEADYDGPRVEWPLTADQIFDIMDRFMVSVCLQAWAMPVCVPDLLIVV